MIQFYQPPYIVKKLFPGYLWELPSDDSIYLTFDDGPHPEVTNWVVNELAKCNALATFFCLGSEIRKYPGLVKEVLTKGHKIGNHTFDHSNGLITKTEDFIDNVHKCDKELEKMGVKTNYFRPPYGKLKRSQVKKLNHKKIAMWSHMAYDFDTRGHISKKIKRLGVAKSGSIIVFHDNLKSFKQLSQLLPPLLEIYSTKGFKFEVLP